MRTRPFLAGIFPRIQKTASRASRMAATKRQRAAELRSEPLEPRRMLTHADIVGNVFHGDCDSDGLVYDSMVSASSTTVESAGIENGEGSGGGCPVCGAAFCTTHLDQQGNKYAQLSALPESIKLAPDAFDSVPAQAPLADTFLLHSRLGAAKKIYLDFTGHTTTGTSWKDGGTINTPAYSVEGGADFSDTELQNIQNIWARVVENFAPFDVDVTTEEPSVDDLRKAGGGDNRWGIRVVIGKNNWGSGGAGVAYLGSFSWNSDTPCFVFPELLGNSNRNIASATSHEIGHALGLRHDGGGGDGGYYRGHGSGATSWGPIMGAPYGKNVLHWSKGEYKDADNQENDLAIIVGTATTVYTPSGNGFGYRPDDFGSSIETAHQPDFSEGLVSSATVSGVVERSGDVDVFEFYTSETLQATINPSAIGPSLDVLAKILDPSGTVLYQSNPLESLAASFAQTVAAGYYYLTVEGTGKGDVLGSGYSDYASLGQYSISLTVSSGTPEIEVYDGTTALADGSANVTFGATPVGEAKSKTFTVKNVGTTDLFVQPASVPDGFTATVNFTSNAVIAPGESMALTVRLDAISAGTYSGELTFANNDSDEDPFSVTISGTATATPLPEIQVLDGVADIPDGGGMVNFGTAEVGKSVAKAFKVKNIGAADLIIQPASVPSGFTVTTNLAADQVVSAGGDATFVVQLDATSEGQYSGSLSFGNNDNDENPFNFSVTGQVVVAPEVQVLEGGVDIVDGISSVTFGSTPAGSPLIKTFTVKNLGTADLQVQPVSVPEGFAATTTFGADTVIPVGGSASFEVQLNALSKGSYSGVVSFQNTDSDEAPFNFTVTGTVTEPEIQVLGSGADITDDVGNVTFGTTPVGTPASNTFMVKNIGSSDLVVQPVSVPSGFTVTSNFDADTIISAGGSATFDVQLDATIVGTYSGTLSFGNTDSDEDPFNFSISGTVNPPPAPEIDVFVEQTGITDGTGSVDFGRIPIGGSPYKVFIVRNSGNLDLTVQPLTVPAGFSIVQNLTTDQVIGAGETASFQIRYDATSVGTANGTVSFATSDTDENPFNFHIAAETYRPPDVQVIDDGEAGFTSTGRWGHGTRSGNLGDHRFSAAGQGSDQATWSFAVSPGLYRVSATWSGGRNRATDSPFSVFDGEQPLSTVDVNQEYKPNDFYVEHVDRKVWYEDIGRSFAITSTSLTVSLSDQANQYVVADSIRIERLGDIPAATPEIEVFLDPTGTLQTPYEIVDDEGHVEFGQTVPGTAVSRSFTVRNTGNKELTVDALTVPAGFTVTSNFSNNDVIPAGESGSFVLRLDGSVIGNFDGAVSFGNSDPDEGPFNFTVSGTVSQPSLVQVMDNGDSRFSTTGAWKRGIRSGYYGDHHFSAAGAGLDIAEWDFNVLPGVYRVSATWSAGQNRDSNSVFAIADGTTALETVYVNQKVAPDDFKSEGARWKDLGSLYTIYGNRLVVTLSDAAEQYVIADAVRIERVGSPPPPAAEIQVFEGTNEIQDDSGVVHFGKISPGNAIAKTFTVKNNGTDNLTVQPVTVPSGFTVTSNLGVDSEIPAGETATFVVQLSTASAGTYSGTLQFVTNDSDENPFDFTITGVVADPTAVQVLDDGDEGFTTAGRWGHGTRSGNLGDHRYSAAGAGSATATWSFAVTPGEYRVSATWRAERNRATNAPFTVSDGGIPFQATYVNQEKAPNDFTASEVKWKNLGETFTITSTTLSVTLSNAADQYVIADAVRVERVGDPPAPVAEVQVFEGANEILDGIGHVNFGKTPAGNPVTKTFTVKNNGNQGLTVQPATVPDGFSLTSNLTAGTVIAPGGEVTFQVQLDASTDGSYAGVLQFINSDGDENPFDFTISGVVADPSTVQIIDDGDNAFVTSGKWRSGTLSGYQGDHHYSGAGSGESTATWSFVVTPGEYRVSASWKGGHNRATNSPFTISDDTGVLQTVFVNQKQTPGEFRAEGLPWQDIGATVTITGTTLAVSLTDSANNYVVADAVRVEKIGSFRDSSIPKGGVTMLPDVTPADDWVLTGSASGDAEIIVKSVDHSNLPFQEYLRLNVPHATVNPQDVSLSFDPAGALTQGDVVYVSFYARGERLDAGIDTEICGYVQNDHTDFKLLTMPITATPEWKRYFAKFEVGSQLNEGDFSLVIHAGYESQSIDIGGLVIQNYGRLGHRLADYFITVKDEAGNPLPEANLAIRMTDHHFKFGTQVRDHFFAISESEFNEMNDQQRMALTPNLMEKYDIERFVPTWSDISTHRDIVRDNFNHVVPTTGLQWEAIANKGTSVPDAAVSRVLEGGQTVTGASVIWQKEGWPTPEDYRPAANPDPWDFHEALVASRLGEESVLSDFSMDGNAPPISDWKLLNEPLHEDYYQEVFVNAGIYENEIAALADYFKRADSIRPEATFSINEYNVINSATDDFAIQYRDLVTDLLAAGAPIDRVGIQAHMSRNDITKEDIVRRLDILAQTGLPIEISEFDTRDDAETPQLSAVEQERMFRDILEASYEHPSVDGFIIWGVSDKLHWRGNAPLYDSSWNIKPEAAPWFDLVQDQWKPQFVDQSVSEHGEWLAPIGLYHGTYEVVARMNGITAVTTIEVEGDGEMTVTLNTSQA